jgi:DNA-binding NtrC family response regulator
VSVPAPRPAPSRPTAGPAVSLDVFRQRGLKELLAEYERSLILTALEASRGHQRRAAAALGVLPSTLCEKMRRLGIRQTPRDSSTNASGSTAN